MTRMRAPAEENLSAREIEVLQLVAKGASNKEIGKELHISTATVKTHLIHIYNKLGWTIAPRPLPQPWRRELSP